MALARATEEAANAGRVSRCSTVERGRVRHVRQLTGLRAPPDDLRPAAIDALAIGRGFEAVNGELRYLGTEVAGAASLITGSPGFLMTFDPQRSTPLR